MATQEEKLTALCKKLRDGVLERDAQIAELKSQVQQRDHTLIEKVLIITTIYYAFKSD